MTRALAIAVALVACADSGGPIDIELVADDQEVTRTFAGPREIRVHLEHPLVVEAWADGGAITDPPADPAQHAPSWLVPHVETGDFTFAVDGGDVTLTVSARGTPPPAALRDRALAWFDPVVLDDPAILSFASVLATISDDHHGGRLLERWFTAFADGPGAGRAAFARYLDELRAAQGSDPSAWDLSVLPMKVTGVHNRIDLARDDNCGELRVSIASTDPVFSPVHFIFLFRAPVRADDVTPDGAVHCRGSARRWARLSTVAPADFPAAARAVVAEGFTPEAFVLAESVELSISPWQWRQWSPDGTGGFTNPLLFQTIDVARVNAPGPLRDAFLADVAANASAIAARTWPVPAAYRSAVAEVPPNLEAPLVDLTGLAVPPELPRALGMVGCPRCHTDDADFLQTGIDRKPSPFYDRELDARAAHLDALAAGAFPPPVPFGPLQDF